MQGAISNTSFGKSCPYAATIIKSASAAAILFIISLSFKLSGWSTSILLSAAVTLTGGGVKTFFLPTGLSG